MYLLDPRESLLTPDTLGVLESDNRKEVRYQWGAQILDLCGLSPEDYKNSTQITVKTIVDCGNCGGGETTDTNKGTCSFDDNVFMIDFEKAVATTIYVFVTAKDNTGAEVKFEVNVPSGSKSASYTVKDYSGPFSIYSVKLNFEDDEASAGDEAEDDKYKYTTDYEGAIVGKTYVLSIIHSLAKTLTEDDFADIIDGTLSSSGIATNSEISFSAGDFTEDASFRIKAMHVSAYMPDDEEFREENSFDFFILTQHEIANIEDIVSSDIENWSMSTVTIKGSSFNQALRRDPESQCKWTTNPEEGDKDVTFSITISKE